MTDLEAIYREQIKTNRKLDALIEIGVRIMKKVEEKKDNNTGNGCVCGEY